MEQSYEQFAAASASGLLRTAVLLTVDRRAAEDLVQDVLERMFVHWSRVENPHAYARAAMARHVTDRWRRAARSPREVGLEAWHDPPTTDGASGRAERGALIEALRQVPPRQRAILVLRYFEDWSEAQIAAELGCSSGTVKSQCAKGLTRLRTVLDVQTSKEDMR